MEEEIELLVKNGSSSERGRRSWIYRELAISPGWSYQPILKGTL
jgi:hypothetical protein